MGAGICHFTYRLNLGGTVNQRIWVLLLSTAAFMLACPIEGHAQPLLTRHVRAVTLNGQAKLIGRLPATKIMQLDVVLPVRDQAGLDAFVAELRNPSSPDYRQFLTPTQFTERFGPTQQNYDAVVRYLQDHGLAIVGGSRDGMDVQVSGPVSAIESAFNVNLLIHK